MVEQTDHLTFIALLVYSESDVGKRNEGILVVLQKKKKYCCLRIVWRIQAGLFD